MKKNTIITDWLEKYGDPEIDLKVEKHLEFINKIKNRKMKEFKWGRIMTANQIGLMISWGTSVIPNRRYMSLEIPFLIIQIYI